MSGNDSAASAASAAAVSSAGSAGSAGGGTAVQTAVPKQKRKNLSTEQRRSAIDDLLKLSVNVFREHCDGLMVETRLVTLPTLLILPNLAMLGDATPVNPIR